LNENFIAERNKIKENNDQIKFDKKKLLNLELKETSKEDAKRLIKEHEKWEIDFEVQIFEDETKLYDKINEEEDKFIEFTSKEENKLLTQLNQVKSKFLSEQNECTSNYENIRLKITDRMLMKLN
jgi:hypothetical protein